MNKDILIEIGMEEIPSRFIRDAANLLEKKISEWLSDSRIHFSGTKVFATPRRLAVVVNEVSTKQPDLRSEVKGPSKKIALNEQEEWSKAALGFARSQGVEPSDLFFKELKGIEYVHAVKNEIGIETKSILSDGISKIITSMVYPKNMRWGKHDLKYVRPIRWLVALYDEVIIPLEITGVHSGRTSRGHRFLGKEVDIQHPSTYVSQLKESFVFVDIEERKQLIHNQINTLAKDKNWVVSIKDDLLEEVLFLVEYPTALYGSFQSEFLEIPQEVLITSMREHQRYFPVFDHESNLLPHFITVRNGDKKSLDVVARGNEKVLKARLADARFFYQEDQNLPIDKALAKLEKIVYHEELGTVGDKVRRIRTISDQIAKFLSVDEKVQRQVTRASMICKFDLVTQMVYEFPELQGVMGEDYALKAGEDPVVSSAISQHYQPRFSGDSSPESIVGAIVSIADKLDSIVGCFSIGIVPTGSQDPYALRRSAAGIVQIVLDQKLNVNLTDLFDICFAVYEESNLLKTEMDDLREKCFDFFSLRVKNVLTDMNIRYDVIDAVMATNINDISSVVRRGKAVMQFVEQSDVKITLESFNRVNNLASKAENKKIEEAYFEENVEHDLYQKWNQLHSSFTKKLETSLELEALEMLKQLQIPITSFFDKVMVMSENENLRRNRLALLANISEDITKIADFQKIVI
ncbi:glycine--tRNA ligase subunit beta [Chengkuizengella axinellae]|uniref:Glycine--tRNA ligase beta subunit n=1 Tax=Chengkuizengella axinellae TaxID=3064388 RepID=A0ABT9IWB1_9BACL|nr:glycine--tRNA ligase subunit beta [Chengkuizengella sp. 2205SS18-9]MDP5273104.1 glycine--tRNA ligase subunit beta [Chengkuizengella sp. 2205SS18-9]